MYRFITKSNNIRRLSSTSWKFVQSNILMPALSPTMEVGTIQEWLIKPGQAYSEGDSLCIVETDKASVAFEMLEDGVLAKILVPDGSSNIKVGDIIGISCEEGDDWENVVVKSAKKVEEKKEEKQEDHKIDHLPVEKVKFSTSIDDQLPSVRYLTGLHNVDLNKIVATGPKGITKGDILEHVKIRGPIENVDQPVVDAPAPIIEQKSEPVAIVQESKIESSLESATPPSTGTYNDIEITSMRNIIANRLTQSKTTIPHQYTKITCELTSINSLRKDLKDKNVKVSLNDFIIKAVAMALNKNISINKIVSPDNKSSNVSETVDISVAVATDSGLITPIVKNANNLSLTQISGSVRDLATRARQKKLQPAEFVGGSFTISNLGMFGIKEFSAIINPPQVCLMAVGGSIQKYIPEKDENGKWKHANFMTVQLSSDGRFVEQNDAVKFLTDFKSHVENPVSMLV